MSIGESLAILSALAALASALAAWRSASVAASQTRPLLTLEPSVATEPAGWHLENVGGATAMHVVWAISGSVERLVGRVEPAGILRPGEFSVIAPDRELRGETIHAAWSCFDGRGALHAWSLHGHYRRYRKPTRWTFWRPKDITPATIYQRFYPELPPLDNRVPMNWTSN
jgi:hypothetical protein